MTNFTYNIQPRKLKNRTVYDVFFYEEMPDGSLKHKRLSGFPSKTAARDGYSNYMANTISRIKLEKDKRHVMYEDAQRVYFDHCLRMLKESSVYDFKHIAVKYSDVFFRRKNLAALTKKDIVAYQDWLWSLKRPDGELYSQKYLVKIYHQFTAFYRWCMQRYEIPDVLAGVSLPVRKTQQAEYQIWTKEEFYKFIDCVKYDKYKALFTLLFYSGVRIGEAQALKVSDYNGKDIYVHATYSKKTLDGSAYKITSTKNYKTRHVPLPKACIEVLDEWVKDRPKDEFLFGKTPPAANPIRNALDRHSAQAGVKRLKIHEFRHTYVSMVHDNGASLVTTAALIGDTPEQVAKTYAHVFKESVEKIISTL